MGSSKKIFKFTGCNQNLQGKKHCKDAAPFITGIQYWNLSFATPDVFRKKNEILIAHCESVGRDSSLRAIGADRIKGRSGSV